MTSAEGVQRALTVCNGSERDDEIHLNVKRITFWSWNISRDTGSTHVAC